MTIFDCIYKEILIVYDLKPTAVWLIKQYNICCYCLRAWTNGYWSKSCIIYPSLSSYISFRKLKMDWSLQSIYIYYKDNALDLWTQILKRQPSCFCYLHGMKTKGFNIFILFFFFFISHLYARLNFSKFLYCL